MPLLVVGINHRTAPLEVRERVVFGPTRLVDALRALNRDGGTSENVIVSTCNRTELYVVDGSADRLGDWLERYHGQPMSLASCTYSLADAEAVEHAFSVASGLDSLVVGEPQILGQMKQAARVAEEAGTLGTMLNKLFQSTFAVAKEVRSTTAGRSGQNSFLGILGLLGASAMGFSTGVSAQVFYAPTDA